jgi:hypothetical protein
MLADRWDRLLADVKMVECAQTCRFQQDAAQGPSKQQTMAEKPA